MLTLNDNGANILLEAAMRSALGLSLHLFTNKITPTEHDKTSDYTEPLGGGYMPLTLSDGGWSVRGALAEYDEQVFTFTGPIKKSDKVYGYYVANGDDKVLWAERFKTGFTPVNNGDRIKIKLRFRMAGM